MMRKQQFYPVLQEVCLHRHYDRPPNHGGLMSRVVWHYGSLIGMGCVLWYPYPHWVVLDRVMEGVVVVS
jgi:hypothetical protein